MKNNKPIKESIKLLLSIIGVFALIITFGASLVLAFAEENINIAKIAVVVLGIIAITLISAVSNKFKI